MTSIFPSGTPVPVPAAVDWFKARHLPERVIEAVTEQQEARRLYGRSYGPQYAEARQLLEARIARANKVLATVPSRQPLVVRGAA